MKLTKEELRQFVVLNHRFGSYIEILYIPETVLESKKELYGLYYGGGGKICVGKYLTYSAASHIEITEKNVDEIVDKIYELLSTDIAEYIHQTFENFGWEYEELKYFDRDEEQYLKFKNEVLRLKDENKKGA